MTHNFVSLKRLKETNLPYDLLYIIKEYSNESIIDIDIFLYGNDNTGKMNFIREFIIALYEKYNISIKCHDSIINIFIEKIPRIIQFIVTNKQNPEAIVSKFDSGHIMMYYCPTALIVNKLWMNKMCFKALETGVSVYLQGSTNYERRIFKHINRNYKVGLGNKFVLKCNKEYTYYDIIEYDNIKIYVEKYKYKENFNKKFKLIKDNNNENKQLDKLFNEVLNYELIKSEPCAYKRYKDNYCDNIYLRNENEDSEDNIVSYKNNFRLINCNKIAKIDEENISNNNNIYSIDSKRNFLIFQNCLCIDKNMKQSGHWSMTIRLDPNTKIYKYIKFLQNKWNEGNIRICGKKIRKVYPTVKYFLNSSIIDNNNRLKISVKAHGEKIEENKVYPIIIAQPRLFIRFDRVTLYWIRLDTLN